MRVSFPIPVLCAAASFPLLLGAASIPARKNPVPIAFVHPTTVDPTPDSQTVDPQLLARDVKPWLKKYCDGCHTGKDATAGIDLAKYTTLEAIQKDQTFWRKALTQIRERSMPPQGSPQPTQDSRDAIVAHLNQILSSADERLIPKDPGSVVLHRLSRLEYNNTVRDLFGVSIQPADSFPADGGGGGGFDNNADTLFVPPVLMERYLDAAEQVLDAADPKRVFVAMPGKGVSARAAAKTILSFHASRAFRRPVGDAELARLLKVYDLAAARKEAFAPAVKLSLKAMLVSPLFLFRAELEPGTGGATALNDYEIASRLSYFLWSSMPDDTLFSLAKQKKLRDPSILSAQVDRMLQSPKSHSFADNFAGQWLKARDLYTTAEPDPGKFKEYTPALRDAMYQEPVLLFESVLKERGSLMTLLDSNYTFVNETLAKHYGIDGVAGDAMRRVSLGDGRRGGILTMGATLVLSSYPQRTSPVLRGKYILSEILGTPPPPPPPVVATLSTDDAPKDGLTFRQRLEKHRTKPECAGCHSRMDPLGFGLENYDAIGRWRTQIGNVAVDSSGQMATGEKFTGPEELKKLLAGRRDDYLRTVTEKMLAYALGRGIESYDLPAVRKIQKAVDADNARADTLVKAIATSYPFLYRKSDPVKSVRR